ncbi:MAG: integrase core domain-containing protein [Stellaceae bacterium]
MGLRPHLPILCRAEATPCTAPWIADYNHNRPHSALAGKPPAARLNNVLGFHS